MVCGWSAHPKKQRPLKTCCAVPVQWRCGVSVDVLARVMRSAGRVPRYAVALVLPFTLTSCEWFTDFKRQPSIWTWEAVKDSTTPSRGNPQNSVRSEEHTSELQSRLHLVCRLLLEKKKKK